MTLPKVDSESQDWILWHKALKKRFGKKEANMIWAKAWSKRAGAGSAPSTVTLRNYMEKQGVEIDTTLAEGFGDFADDIGGFFGGMFGTLKWIALGGLIIVGGVVVYSVVKVVKNPKKYEGMAGSVSKGAVSATPMGRGSKLLKG